MPDAINVHNGGEAPHAANSVANPALAAAGEGDLMQQNGGQAPLPDAGGDKPPAAATALSQGTSGGELSAPPPLGGVVQGQ
jgi:hypothetical protein